MTINSLKRSPEASWETNKASATLLKLDEENTTPKAHPSQFSTNYIRVPFHEDYGYPKVSGWSTVLLSHKEIFKDFFSTKKVVDNLLEFIQNKENKNTNSKCRASDTLAKIITLSEKYLSVKISKDLREYANPELHYLDDID